MGIGVVLLGPAVVGSLLKSMTSVASIGITPPFHPSIVAVVYMTMKGGLERCLELQIPGYFEQLEPEYFQLGSNFAWKQLFSIHLSREGRGLN